MLAIQVVINGELRKENGDFIIRSIEDTTYLDTNDINKVVEECMDIINDDYWDIPTFVDNSYGDFVDCYENLYPDIEIYLIDDELWNKCKELNITPELDPRWRIAGISTSECIENDEELNEETIKNKIFVEQKLFFEVNYDPSKLI